LGGNSIIPDADFNKTQFAFSALSEAGVGGFSKSDLTNYLAGKQVNVNPYISAYFEGFQEEQLKKIWEQLWSLCMLVLQIEL
jgi:zinc protease